MDTPEVRMSLTFRHRGRRWLVEGLDPDVPRACDPDVPDLPASVERYLPQACRMGESGGPSVRRSRRAPRRGPRAAGHGEPGLSARTAGRVGPVRA